MKVRKLDSPLTFGEVPHFDGEVALLILGGGDPDFKMTEGDSAYFVKFHDGAMNHWHTHTSRQILIFTEGRGVVEERDGESIELGEGEMARVEATVAHRHGAAPGNDCAHIAIQEGFADWLE